MKNKKLDRNKVNRERVNQLTEQQKKDREHYTNIKRIGKLGEYIKNEFNGRYYLARYNMLADQIETKEIVEKIDGATKSMNLIVAEALLMRMRAIDSFRISHFAKQDLINEFKMTEEQIKAVEDSYHKEKIVREDYGEDPRPGKNAEFVHT